MSRLVVRLVARFRRFVASVSPSVSPSVSRPRAVDAALLVAIAVLAATVGRAPVAHASTSAAPAAASAPKAAASRATPFYETPFEHRPDVATLTRLGRALFFDRALSASGTMSCASCHDPAHAYGPANARAVQLGGPSGRAPGMRAVPSLKYHQDIPPFSEHFSDNDNNDSEDLGPTGGLGWDGRASSAHEQAAAPLLSPFEMANRDPGALVARLKTSTNAGAMRDAFGAHVLDDTGHAWNATVLALEVFQQSPTDFYPYTSRYDAFLRHQTTLTPAELRGLALFADPNKGNCATCHPSGIRRGSFPQFTDNGFIALGVPRNRAIAANTDAGYADLGLCGPLRTDLSTHAEYCGLFRTPTLRNVALRPVFFHNGVFTHLKDVVRFYAQRDSNPGRFYPRDRAGRVKTFDDLPAKFQANVNRETPFGQKPGDTPTLSAADVDDIVAFLNTLTDR